MLYTKNGVKAEVEKEQRAIMEKAGWTKFDENAPEVVAEETEDEKALKADLAKIAEDARLAKIAEDAKNAPAFVKLNDKEFNALSKEEKQKYALAEIAHNDSLKNQ